MKTVVSLRIDMVAVKTTNDDGLEYGTWRVLSSPLDITGVWTKGSPAMIKLPPDHPVLAGDNPLSNYVRRVVEVVEGDAKEAAE